MDPGLLCFRVQGVHCGILETPTWNLEETERGDRGTIYKQIQTAWPICTWLNLNAPLTSERRILPVCYCFTEHGWEMRCAKASVDWQAENLWGVVLSSGSIFPSELQLFYCHIKLNSRLNSTAIHQCPEHLHLCLYKDFIQISWSYSCLFYFSEPLSSSHELSTVPSTPLTSAQSRCANVEVCVCMCVCAHVCI